MSTSPTANWNYPTSVRFGAGRIKEMPQVCKDLGFAKPLLVTDPFLAAQPMTQSVVKGLRDAGLGVGVFSDVKSNPNDANVEAGLKVLKAGGYDRLISVECAGFDFNTNGPRALECLQNAWNNA